MNSALRVMAIFAATSRYGGWKYDDYRVSKLLKLSHFVVNEYYIIWLCCSVVRRTLFTQFGAIEAQYDSMTRVSVVDTQWYWKLGKLLTSFSWNLLIAKNLYSLSKCISSRLSINNCVVLSMLVAEIKWKQMNFTCQNKLVFVFLSCTLGNYVRSRACRVVISGTHIYTKMNAESHQK